MAPSSSKNAGPVLLALAILYLVWGSTYLAMRIAIEGIPPLLMAAIRFLAAGAALVAVMRLRGRPMPSARQWRNAGLTGLLLCTFGNGLVAISQQWVATSLAAVMVASTTLWTALFAGIAGKWPRPLEWVGLLVGAAGVVVLNLDGELRGSPLGTVLLILAPASWALGSVFAVKLEQPRGLMGSGAQMLAGGLGLLLLALLRGDTADVHPSPRSLAALLYLIIFGSLIAYSAYGYLLHTVRPALATSYAYVNPVVAMALGVSLGGEHVSTAGFVGGGLIISAVVLVGLFRERTPTPAPAEP